MRSFFDTGSDLLSELFNQWSQEMLLPSRWSIEKPGAFEAQQDLRPAPNCHLQSVTAGGRWKSAEWRRGKRRYGQSGQIYVG